MESPSSQPTSPMSTRTAILIVLLCIAYIVWSQYQSFGYMRKIDTLQVAYDTYAEKLRILQASSTESDASVRELYGTLSYVIEEEKNKNQILAEKLGIVSNTVGSLDKLSKSDPQLLKKYSKVYFLNENYAPVSLATLPVEYTYDKKITYQIHADVIYFLQKLIDSANKDGVHPLIISAYRSFATQGSVKTINVMKFGTTKANQLSAEQGFSEHQLGSTVDITTPTTGVNFNAFEGTPEFAWLKNNAHTYGFILSYPKNNTYYAYEPWHWRFVGVELASQLHAQGKYFYDYDQRIIDGYLTKMFDR